MKSPTDILRKEHDTVLKILDKLENNLEKRNVKLLGENMTILEKEFDLHSLKKEEKALFPEIEKFIPREGGPTGMMIIEHKDLVESMKTFNITLKENNFEKLDDVGYHIISLLRQHIHKENNVLFMMADMHLDDKQKEIVMEKFEKFDMQKEGKISRKVR